MTQNPDTETELAASQDSYLDDVCLIADNVWNLMNGNDAGFCIFNFHAHFCDINKIRSRRPALIRSFLDHASNATRSISAQRPTLPSGSIFATPELGDDEIDALAGDWLALYFLGIAFPQIWEPVSFFAEGSGFPRGPSLCKAVGDIYRQARLGYVRQPDLNHHVYVLDHNPLAIGALGARYQQKRNRATAIAFLGMLYELLQLRLYLHSGGPLTFCVPGASLERALASELRRNSVNTATALDAEKVTHTAASFLWQQLQKAYPPSRRSRQKVCIGSKADTELSLMPGCVMASTQGIFRTRVADLVMTKQTQNERSETQRALEASNIGRAGNYLPSRMLKTFRHKLENTDQDEIDLDGDRSEFVNRCHALALNSNSLTP